MKKREGSIDIQYSDIRSAVFAIESWLDAFRDEPEYEDEIPGIERVLAAFQLMLKVHGPDLSLIPGGKSDG